MLSHGNTTPPGSRPAPEPVSGTYGTPRGIQCQPPGLEVVPPVHVAGPSLQLGPTLSGNQVIPQHSDLIAQEKPVGKITLQGVTAHGPVSIADSSRGHVVSRRPVGAPSSRPNELSNDGYGSIYRLLWLYPEVGKLTDQLLEELKRRWDYQSAFLLMAVLELQNTYLQYQKTQNPHGTVIRDNDTLLSADAVLEIVRIFCGSLIPYHTNNFNVSINLELQLGILTAALSIIIRLDVKSLKHELHQELKERLTILDRDIRNGRESENDFHSFGDGELLIRYSLDFLSNIPSDRNTNVTIFQSIASLFFAAGLIYSFNVPEALRTLQVIAELPTRPTEWHKSFHQLSSIALGAISLTRCSFVVKDPQDQKRCRRVSAQIAKGLIDRMDPILRGEVEKLVKIGDTTKSKVKETVNGFIRDMTNIEPPVNESRHVAHSLLYLINLLAGEFGAIPFFKKAEEACERLITLSTGSKGNLSMLRFKAYEVLLTIEKKRLTIEKKRGPATLDRKDFRVRSSGFRRRRKGETPDPITQEAKAAENRYLCKKTLEEGALGSTLQKLERCRAELREELQHYGHFNEVQPGPEVSIDGLNKPPKLNSRSRIVRKLFEMKGGLNHGPRRSSSKGKQKAITVGSPQLYGNHGGQPSELSGENGGSEARDNLNTPFPTETRKPEELPSEQRPPGRYTPPQPPTATRQPPPPPLASQLPRRPTDPLRQHTRTGQQTPNPKSPTSASGNSVVSTYPKKLWREPPIDLHVKNQESSCYKIKLKGKNRAKSVTLSPDNKYAAFVYDKKVHISRIPPVAGQARTNKTTPELPLKPERKKDTFLSAVFSMNFLLTVSHNNQVQFTTYRIERKTNGFRLPEKSHPLCLAVSQDSALLAVGLRMEIEDRKTRQTQNKPVVKLYVLKPAIDFNADLDYRYEPIATLTYRLTNAHEFPTNISISSETILCSSTTRVYSWGRPPLNQPWNESPSMSYQLSVPGRGGKYITSITPFIRIPRGKEYYITTAELSNIPDSSSSFVSPLANVEGLCNFFPENQFLYRSAVSADGLLAAFLTKDGQVKLALLKSPEEGFGLQIEVIDGGAGRLEKESEPRAAGSIAIQGERGNMKVVAVSRTGSVVVTRVTGVVSGPETGEEKDEGEQGWPNLAELSNSATHHVGNYNPGAT